MTSATTITRVAHPPARRCDLTRRRVVARSSRGVDEVRLDVEPDESFGKNGLGRKKIWLGRRVLQFEPARKFVWHLHLRGEEDFRDWAYNSRRGCVFIPREPDKCYADDGWRGWDDWCGTSVDFETARAWARSMGFKSQQDWWANVESLPHRIPERPGQYYRHSGWLGYADFLGLQDVSADDADANDADVDDANDRTG
ncbi:unnamed product [Ostreococcus tauri]|uniref:Unnamed product n=1 Tax=Ostreococcus tauri TaxID=70448 RepID=Q01CF0_OSTTA|nr:unnamed product [Ostreococcus tauri]CAL53003.1 unnamed product [Ostreococcus tauri]|eukprot:XP_003078263.1 unnamed product [Ostreococcus tauri]